MMGVVNNAVYVNFMEDARVDALAQIGCRYKGMEEKGFAGPVLTLNVEYKSSARFDDELEISVKFERYTGVRLFLSYEMRDKRTDRLIATAESTHCFIDMKSGEPVIIKHLFPEWHKALTEAAEPNKTVSEMKDR